MSTFVPPQLASILGPDLDAIDDTALKRLIGVAENDVLDYKGEHYGKSEGAHRELAWDLAGFANAGGGVLIVGMVEDDDTGEATEVVPLAVQPHGTEEDTRYRQILASIVYPMIQVNTHWVDVDGGAVLVVSVPPSFDRPHAVVKDGALRYPIRDGRGRRWLRESEIADAYRSRFGFAEDSAARVAELRGGLIDSVRQLMMDSNDESSAWLTMALSPDRPGHLRIDHRAVEETREWASRIRTVPFHFIYRSLDPTAAFRSIQLTDDTAPRRAVFHLASSGAAAGAIRLDQRSDRVPSDKLVVLDVWVFLAAMSLAELLAGHATDRCGTGGSATMLINLELVGGDAAQLVHNRQWGLDSIGRPVQASTPLGRQTVALDDLWPASPAMVATTADLLCDVTSPFGLPAPYQADRLGRIRQRYVERDLHPAITRWADDHGIEMTDDIA